jgi:hypothetical protein
MYRSTSRERRKKGASPPFFSGKQHPKTVLIAFDLKFSLKLRKKVFLDESV